MIEASRIPQALASVVDQYPPERREKACTDLRRQEFHVGTVSGLHPRGNVADIGGGVGLFTPGCAAVGMDAVLVDDFRDQINDELGDEALDLHRSLGVQILNRDVIREGLGLPSDSMDVITTFDSMEHWHDSPKGLFADVMTALRPGGWFLLGVPNCVNLRKRITVPLGRGKWSQMADWYERPRFRGHVREADVDDLRYIARDMRLTDVSILGRNWLGYVNHRNWVRLLTPAADRALQKRPTLCSDLYLLGRKPS